LWWPSLTKDMQTEQLLCWSGMTDTEHTTSSSNEEEAVSCKALRKDYSIAWYCIAKIVSLV